MAFNAKVAVSLLANLTGSGDLATPLTKTERLLEAVFAEGAGANQANRIWHDQRTLTASSTEDLDLSGSALLDPYGVAVAFARVKLIAVIAAAGNTNNVLLGGVANGLSTWLAPQTTGTLAVRPGAWVVHCDPSATGMAVTAGTADLLHVANSAGGSSVTYDIYIAGSAT